MKSLMQNMWGILCVALAVSACNQEDHSPELHPILGEWIAADGQFLTLSVDGVEVSKSEFGKSVYSYHTTLLSSIHQ